MPNLASLNLNRLLIFAAVVEAGSLSAAAQRLGLAKTMVSTHMQRLEAEIGASLLVRTTRRLSLTDAGEAFYEACRRILRETEEAVAAAGEETADPRGLLRVSAAVDYCANVVAPLAVQLIRRYPQLKIEMIGEDRRADLIAEGVDVAIRVGRLADSSHQAARVGTFEQWLVASPDFFTGPGWSKPLPCTPEEAATHPFISLTVLSGAYTRHFENAAGEKRVVRFDSPILSNTANAVRRAALAGGGMAVMPDFAVAGDIAAGRLLRLLPDWSLPGGGIHCVFPAARHRPKKIRVFVDALREYLAGPATGWV
ncbi:MAG TPA: LysR family transcriptional regulator [Burkholderiales bacterium]|jgi:DNA-binding transcriptional LysR family regulator